MIVETGRRRLAADAGSYPSLADQATGVFLRTFMHALADAVGGRPDDGWVEVARGRLEASNPAILKEPLAAGDLHLYRSPGEDYAGHHRDFG